MIDILWDIVCCTGLVALTLLGILLCVVLVSGIVQLIKMFKEDV